ncbi:DUF6104 family protein [Streptomyces sp. NPDC056921]|uniref:DUF6104 family protein n=1 Tax=Streptomyces sp. NPDC056921 TaxID=3345966 RepID=UPI003626DE5E
MVTDRGIEELEKRCGEEGVTLEWLSAWLPGFVDLNPGFEIAATGYRAGAPG